MLALWLRWYGGALAALQIVGAVAAFRWRCGCVATHRRTVGAVTALQIDGAVPALRWRCACLQLRCGCWQRTDGFVTLKFQSLKNNFPGEQKRFLRQGNMCKISKTRKYVQGQGKQGKKVPA